jgi:RNA polymerase sigma-70 factor (ECF subfamily)
VENQVPDLALAVAASRGNSEAFGELARRYRRPAVRIAASIAGPHAAEDIAQDALLLAFRSISALDEPDCFGAWLAAIVRNRALSVARRDSRIVRVDWDPSIEARLKEIAEVDRRRQTAASELAAGIDALPQDLSLVMRLRWLDEMPISRIAAFSGLTVSTVKWRLYQGRKTLRAWARIQTNGAEKNYGNEHSGNDSKTDRRPAKHGEDSPDEPRYGAERGGRSAHDRAVQSHSRSAQACRYHGRA